MILHLNQGIDQSVINSLKDKYQAIHFALGQKDILVTPSKDKQIQAGDEKYVEQHWVMESDIQLASSKYMPEKRQIEIANNLSIGGNTGNTLVITGPCSVESEEQIEASASFIHSLGIKVLRAGCYKPRTSPYTFQGLGLEGLKLLDKVRQKYGLKIITEVKDSSHIDEVIEYADIVQIGAKAMYDQGILKKCAKTQKPILIKRGFGSTLQEFVQAAEFVLSGGNPNVILCERGIRTFETKTRFTLDLCGVAYLKEYTNLPIILDPSHAMGYSYGVADLTRACIAMGIDGVLIETHPNPAIAKSDASQQLNHEQFQSLYQSMNAVAGAVGRKIV
ncbi:MAG: 3-deoxy-7-phosphoheptulonate synthase [Chitinophagales bacterium]|nr:3-deoxy-7-phosphoheptulonate synthase [Chitinophagales bacterium]